MSNKLRVSQSGAGNPTTAVPTFKGEIYINETTGALWRATGTSAGNWTLLEKNQTSEVSSATITPTGQFASNETFITGLAVNTTFAVPSGTPVNGNQLLIRLKDNGTARTLTWNAIYRGEKLTIPTTTVVGETLYLGFKYNENDNKWDLIALL